MNTCRQHHKGRGEATHNISGAVMHFTCLAVPFPYNITELALCTKLSWRWHSISTKLSLKICDEMKHLSSTATASILRDSTEAVKYFHWDTVLLELQQHVPTLMSLLSRLVGKSAGRSPLRCLLPSMILKSRHHQLSLVQRAISVMLYGNGTAKQAKCITAPLIVCVASPLPL